MIDEILVKKFHSKFKINPLTDCWDWCGNIASNGYGRIIYQYKQYSTHRLSWEIHNGKIPEGMFVCHHCDNKKCVNPNHLFIGTCKDNVQDYITKFDHIGNKKLSQHEVLEIIRLRKEGKSERRLSKIFKISRSSIRNILHGKSWKKISKLDNQNNLKSNDYINENIKLSKADVLKIVELAKDGMKYRLIAEMFNVKTHTIKSILAGRKRSSITGFTKENRFRKR